MAGFEISFDRRKDANAKAANDGAGVVEAPEKDMFEQAGIAAE